MTLARALLVLTAGIAALFWLMVLGLSQGFAGGVEFPPTLGDFLFLPQLYGIIYGFPALVAASLIAYFIWTRRKAD